MTGDWARYWRSPDQPLEAMYAHFERHAYHRHSHETYSFGVTEAGVQAFACRGSAHTSTAGMVMAFNPDDPHDGHPLGGPGFTYRMVHIGQPLVADVLAEVTERPGRLPLFAEPVVCDTNVAAAVRSLHAALLAGAGALRRDELLHRVVLTAVRRAARSPGAARPVRPGPGGEVARVAERARQVLDATCLQELTAAELAGAVGRSRFAVYRAFQAVHGMAPSDYQRQRRLRAARALIADGQPLAEVAAGVGFTDQSHLTRWFTRTFGITPAAYRRAAGRPAPRTPEPSHRGPGAGG